MLISNNKANDYYVAIEMPTGLGKSLVKEALIEYCITNKEKIIYVIHVKEIIQ